MENFTAIIKVKEPVSLTESLYANAIFEFKFRRQTKLYFVFDVTSGKTWFGIHMPKYNFSEQRAADFMARHSYDIKKLNVVK